MKRAAGTGSAWARGALSMMFSKPGQWLGGAKRTAGAVLGKAWHRAAWIASMPFALIPGVSFPTYPRAKLDGIDGRHVAADNTAAQAALSYSQARINAATAAEKRRTDAEAEVEKVRKAELDLVKAEGAATKAAAEAELKERGNPLKFQEITTEMAELYSIFDASIKEVKGEGPSEQEQLSEAA